MTTKRNLKITLAYDGAPFCGWQVQPGRTSIQGTLKESLRRVTGEDILPQGSGRTDAGVHALAQVASINMESPIPAENLLRALNHNLPRAIRVLFVEEVAADFHARRSAKAKTYRYRTYRGALCSPFLANHVYHYPYPLDEAAVMSAAARVIGEHDFTSFAVADPDKAMRESEEAASNLRTIFSSAWRREGEELIYEVCGSGFLHHMIRNLVGTFLMVGRGTLTVEDIPRILAAKDRSLAGGTAPARGLYLVSVDY